MNFRENDRRRTFVEQYLLSGNATKAAIAAGYSKRTAYSQGNRLLKNAEVKLAIRALQRTETAAVIAARVEIATRAERQAFWTKTQNDPTVPLAIRLRASELLGKSQADFVEVRMAPIVTDPSASDEELVKGLTGMLGKLRLRLLEQDAAGQKALPAPKPVISG